MQYDGLEEMVSGGFFPRLVLKGLVFASVGRVALDHCVDMVTKYHLLRASLKELDDSYGKRGRARVTGGSPDDPDLPIRKNSDGILETSIVGYENGSGKRVTYVGAVHIGELAYYRKLQEILETHDRVFYEGVGSGCESVSNFGVRKFFDSFLDFFRRVADYYGLFFQVDEMDYDRDGWEVVDASIEDIASKTSANNLVVQPSHYLGGLALDIMSRVMCSLIYIPRSEVIDDMLGGDSSLDFGYGAFREGIVMKKLDEFDNGDDIDAALFYGTAHWKNLHDCLLDKKYHIRDVLWIEAW